MKKLELRHIAPYLAHRLKIKRGERILVMNTGRGSSVYWVGISAVVKWFNSDMASKPFPILRPLSDLTKPCLEGRLIPIVELAKINDKYIQEPFKVYSEDWSKINDCEKTQYNCDHIVKTGNMGDLVYQFAYWEKLQRFSNRDNTNGRPLAVSRQLELFEKLFEWHFDVYGLIEQGLAIDINTLN